MRKFFDSASIFVLAVATVGLAVRFTVRDAFPATAWVYYFFGLPAVLAVLLMGGAALSILAHRFRRCAIAALAAISVAGAWWTNAHHDNPCAVRDDSLRIVSWNVSRLRAGREPIAAELAQLAPDVALLVEAGNDNAEAWSYWRERFPGYDVSLPGGGILAIVRGAIESTSFREITGISSFAALDVIVGGRPLRIAAVDLDASPRFDKRLLVPRVFQLATADVDRPLVVAGDFNTPVDSPAFAGAREDFRHAFEAAGRGLLATWPARYPVTAIDHVWTGPGVTPLCASLHVSDASDHRAVVVDAAF
jgi:endonuclease/exonuclease/phosphatase (EEP) superfamily protein YafD